MVCKKYSFARGFSDTSGMQETLEKVKKAYNQLFFPRTYSTNMLPPWQCKNSLCEMCCTKTKQNKVKEKLKTFLFFSGLGF